MRIVTSAVMAAVAAAIAITSLTASAAPAATAATAQAAAAAAEAGPAAGRAAAPLDDRLSGVACETDKDCLAVGTNSTHPADRAPLAVTWNGKAWQSVRVKLPTGAVAGWLDGVSCPPAAGTHCVATGAFAPKKFGASYWTGLTDAWNGKAWTPAPVNGTADVELSAVSCLSASNCLAVGSDQSPVGGYSQGLAYRWNGKQWTEVNPPVPPASNSNRLTSVSCTAGPFCVAVGYASAPDKTLAYQWNGTKWTAMTPAQPTGAGGLELAGVSCTSPKSCTAVGDIPGGPGTVAEVWNGKAWTVTAPMAWQRGATIPRVASVSCASAGRCVAVGYVGQTPVRADSVVGQAAASVWNGRKWTAATVPATGKDQESYFNSVTCLKTTFCVAVGEYGPATGATPPTALSGFWDGRRWHLKAAR